VLGLKLDSGANLERRLRVPEPTRRSDVLFRMLQTHLETLRTDSPTFVVLLIGIVILIGALTFFPALLLGPIVQSLTTQLF